MTTGQNREGLLKKMSLHFLFWMCYLLINEMEPIIVDGISEIGCYLWFFAYAILAGIFYFIYFYLNPKFLSKNRYIEYTASLVGLFFVYNLARQLQLNFLHFLYPEFTRFPAINLVPISYTSIMPRSFTYYFFHIPLFTCFFIWMNSRALQKVNFEKDKLLLIQKQELADLKTANIQSELSFLQSQINPHFLFNTLNSFYSKSVQINPELADGIETLAQIMRYALRPYGISNYRNGRVDLNDEILHIDNVIKIYKLRYPNKMCLDFNVHGKTDNVAIIPLVLITLVENVFKHGDLNDKINPAKLFLQVKDSVLTFTTQNKNRKGMKEQGVSIGLSNITNRLKLAYENDFSFKSEDKNGFFCAFLKIDLN